MCPMSSPRRVRPRKQPKTKAGETIADAVITATEQILADTGLDGFSTNRVAERAGVSVGSLYQYFPNKEALLAEVAKRLERRAERLILELLERTREEPLESVIEGVVDVLLGDGLSQRRVRHVLRYEVPSSWIRDTSEPVDREIQAAVVAELGRRNDVRSDASPEMLTWISTYALELLVEQVVLNQPALLESAELRRELIRLVHGYLKK